METSDMQTKVDDLVKELAEAHDMVDKLFDAAVLAAEEQRIIDRDARRLLTWEGLHEALTIITTAVGIEHPEDTTWWPILRLAQVALEAAKEE